MVTYLPHQIPTSKKQRNLTSTAEQEGIWVASTRSSRMCRGSWWLTLRRCCREGRLSLVRLFYAAYSKHGCPLSVSVFGFCPYLYLSIHLFLPLLSCLVLNSSSVSSVLFCVQHSTPRPATCPRSQRSTGATPSISTPGPPMPSWQPVVSFSSCSLSMCASGGSEREGREEEGGGTEKWKMSCTESADTKETLDLKQDPCS